MNGTVKKCSFRFLMVVIVFGGVLASSCAVETSPEKTATLAPINRQSAPAEAAVSPVETASPVESAAVASPTETASPAQTPPAVDQSHIDAPQSDNSDTAVVVPDKLMIPVIGVKRDDLRDVYTQSRSAGRTHNAIDIMAACGTPVVAATTGEIIKFFDSDRGGITTYQLSTDKTTVYYYAHLNRRADAVKEGDTVRQGTVIGYVGDTGNSGAGNCHLHFSISTVTDPKRYHDGTNVNPYPLLKEGVEAR